MIPCASVAALLSELQGTEARGAEEPIFQTTTGRGLDHRHVGDAFRLAVRRAGVHGRGRLSLPSLRHGFASLLIANGPDVVFVSRQLGHANPTVTLSTYAHLFARADHAEAARSALEATAQAMRTVNVTGLGDTPNCGNGCGNSEAGFETEPELPAPEVAAARGRRSLG